MANNSCSEYFPEITSQSPCEGCTVITIYHSGNQEAELRKGAQSHTAAGNELLGSDPRKAACRARALPRDAQLPGSLHHSVCGVVRVYMTN